MNPLILEAEEMLGVTIPEIARSMDTDDLDAYTNHPFLLRAIGDVLVGLVRAAAKKHGDRWLR